MKKELNFKEDMMISANIEKDLLELPSSIFDYSLELEESEDELKRLKLKFDVESAKAIQNIRSDVSKKITEKSIEMEVNLNEDLNALREEILVKEKDKRILAAAIKAFEFKAASLKQLTSLLVTGIITNASLAYDISKSQNDNIRTSKEKLKPIKADLDF